MLDAAAALRCWRDARGIMEHGYVALIHATRHGKRSNRCDRLRVDLEKESGLRRNTNTINVN